MAGYEVQNQKASLNEYNVAAALSWLGLDFVFQWDFDGGRLVSGGQVIDFVVKTVPKWTPLWVHGDYWHSGQRTIKDQLNEQKVNASGKWMPGVVIYGSESQTIEDAKSAARRVLQL